MSFRFKKSKSARALREERILRAALAGVDSELQLDLMLGSDAKLRDNPVLMAAVKKRMLELEPRLRTQ